MQFAHPQYMWLFLLFIPLIAWYIWKQHNSKPTLAISTVSAFASVPKPMRQYLRHLLFVLRLAVIGCLIIVLCRPQLKDNWRTTNTEGTDIVLAIDISGSMLAKDFKPDRLEAAKEIAAQFINGRENDNIGVVIFAGESLTGVPMTVDRDQLINYISTLKMGMISDGTAIGDGIATSINRIKEGKAKSKTIILLTDGSNNTGVVAPLSAADVAKEMKIKIYTIGVGTNSPSALMPIVNQFGRIEYQPRPVVIDEATLRQIANTTGGKYFRAIDNNSLKNIFHEIDQMEKTKMDVKHFSHTEDNYMLWAWLAIGFFGLELLLRYTVFRSVP